MLQAVRRKSNRIERVERRTDSLFLYSQAGILRLQPVNAQIIRLTRTAGEKFSQAEMPWLVPWTPYADWTWEETDEDILLRTDGIVAMVNRENASCRFASAAGRTCLTERARNPYSLEAFEAFRLSAGGKIEKEKIRTADGEKEIIREAARESEGTLYHTRVYFDWLEDEALYGLGQHEGAFVNLRGRTLYLHQANRKIAVPLLVSGRGYGILFNHNAPMIFADSEEDSHVSCEAAEEIDYFYIHGECADDVVKGYRRLTGKAALLPRWAFGYIQSQERYESAQELMDVVESFRQKEIGLDCIVQDWMTWPDGEWGQKSFDQSRFPDPAGMTDAIHKQHAHLMISIWPNMTEGCPDRLAFDQAKALLPGSEVYNAFDGKARALYWKQVREGLFVHGIDAWWCDSSEPYTPEWMHSEKPEPSRMYEEFVRQAQDHMPATLTNAFAFYHARALYEGQRGETSSKRVVNLTRSSSMGQQRFGTILWSGDTAASWDTLREQVAAGLQFCASGLPYWTNDIGAFFVRPGESWYWQGLYPEAEKDPAYCELYTRWFQYACFLPVFRAHGTDCRREPWNFMAENGKYYEALKKAIRFRYSLLPHIYSLAGRAWLEDGSVIRMLSFVFPDDPEVRDCGTQFMLGEELMVCPVLRPGEQTTKVYLPAGCWYDYHTGEKLQGGRYLERETVLDTIPLFVRAGSILPTMEPGQWAYEGRLTDSGVKLIFRVYPGCDAEYLLYDDAGDGYAYEQGDYTLHRLCWNEQAQTLDTGDLRGEVLCFSSGRPD